MSTSSSSRRPSTANTNPLPQRMPFEAAEALLWGRKTHQDHEYLFSQMKDLSSQHLAYDARITATEAIAEAAEAATHRIRHMETQIAAMESDDRDRPFDKWAEGAITQLKVFVDNNLNVRQKLNNLEGRFCEAVEEFERVGGVVGDVRGLVRRLDQLEAERREDKRRVAVLEEEVAEIRAAWKLPVSGGREQQAEAARSKVPVPVRGRAVEDDPDVSDATTEEDDVPPSRALVQVLRSPSVDPERPEATMQPPITKGRQTARMNLMRRASIYDPPVVQADKAVQLQAGEPRRRPAPSRVAPSSEEAPKAANKTAKRKRDDDAPTQRMTRAKIDVSKVKQSTAPVTTEKSTTAGSQTAPGNAAKQKLVAALLTQKPAAAPSTQKQAQTQAKTAKSAPRKPDGPSCKQCRQAHQRCDRAHPACGRCVKLSRSGACDYPDTQSAATQPAVRSTDAQKKIATQQARRPAKNDTRGGTSTGTKICGSEKSKSSTAQSTRPSTAKGTSNIEPALVPRSRKPRLLPEATDLETFLKM